MEHTTRRLRLASCLCGLMTPTKLLFAAFALLLPMIAPLSLIAVSPNAAAQSPTPGKAMLQSHEASYALTVDPGTAPAGVAVSAAMRFRVVQGCRDLRMQSGFEITIAGQDGGPITIAQRGDIRETVDGSRMESQLETRMPGSPSETLTAAATRNPDGTVSATLGDGRRLALPARTLFAVGHFNAQLAAAGRGDVQISHLVFDGSLPDAVEMSTVIGRPRPVTGESGHQGDAIPDAALYPMRIAIFPASSKAEVPLAEITATTGSSGISSRIGIDAAGMRFSGRLTDLRLLPAERC